jgi:hypothetical protein
MHEFRALRTRQVIAMKSVAEKISAVLEEKKCKKPLGNWVLALTY